jgi:hypothetical protein
MHTQVCRNEKDWFSHHSELSICCCCTCVVFWNVTCTHHEIAEQFLIWHNSLTINIRLADKIVWTRK